MDVISISWRKYALGIGAGLAVSLFLFSDWNKIVDSFYEQRVETKALSVWRRQATAVTYDQCRNNAAACLDKIVFWEISHLTAGTSHHQGNAAEPIVWANEAQVPIANRQAGNIKVLAKVRAVHPQSVELVFLGSPQAVFGGTTWPKKFSYASGDVLKSRDALQSWEWNVR